MMKYGKIIFDPNSEDAKALIGKKVVSSTCFSLINRDTYNFGYDGILESINPGDSCPFKIKDIHLQLPPTCSAYTGATFIREVKEEPKRYVPYSISKKEVRDSLRGRWFIVKETNNEMSVNDLIPPDEDGYSFINGFQVEEFLEKCTWLDGTPCGEEVKENEKI